MAGICRNRTYKRIFDSHNGFEDHEMHQHFNIPMSYYVIHCSNLLHQEHFLPKIHYTLKNVCNRKIHHELKVGLDVRFLISNDVYLLQVPPFFGRSFPKVDTLQDFAYHSAFLLFYLSISPNLCLNVNLPLLFPLSKKHLVRARLNLQDRSSLHLSYPY